MTVYSPQPGQVITEEMCKFADRLEEDGYSDAENVVLLHRDSKRLSPIEVARFLGCRRFSLAPPLAMLPRRSRGKHRFAIISTVRQFSTEAGLWYKKNFEQSAGKLEFQNEVVHSSNRRAQALGRVALRPGR